MRVLPADEILSSMLYSAVILGPTGYVVSKYIIKVPEKNLMIATALFASLGIQIVEFN
jgi:hypothetical protein